MKQIEKGPEADQISGVKPRFGDWVRGSKKRQFVLAVALGAVLAIISW